MYFVPPVSHAPLHRLQPDCAAAHAAAAGPPVLLRRGVCDRGPAGPAVCSAESWQLRAAGRLHARGVHAASPVWGAQGCPAGRQRPPGAGAPRQSPAAAARAVPPRAAGPVLLAPPQNHTAVLPIHRACGQPAGPLHVPQVRGAPVLARAARSRRRARVRAVTRRGAVQGRGRPGCPRRPRHRKGLVRPVRAGGQGATGGVAVCRRPGWRTRRFFSAKGQAQPCPTT